VALSVRYVGDDCLHSAVGEAFGAELHADETAVLALERPFDPVYFVTRCGFESGEGTRGRSGRHEVGDPQTHNLIMRVAQQLAGSLVRVEE
jgi:hypothetical protein